jgi:hypothetical protein
LTGDQRAALEAATKTAESGVTDVVDTDEQEAVQGLCRSRLRFATASRDDLRGLLRAVQPVYARLRRNPRTAEWLDRISQLKREVNAPPDAPSCPPSGPPPQTQALSIPSGTYTRTIVPADYRALGLRPTWDFGRWRLEFDHGILEVHAPGEKDPEWWTYQTFDAKIRATGPPGTMVADYSYRHGELVFRDLRFLVCGGVPGNADCLIDPSRSDAQGGYETTFAGIPKPWVRQR